MITLIKETTAVNRKGEEVFLGLFRKNVKVVKVKRKKKAITTGKTEPKAKKVIKSKIKKQTVVGRVTHYFPHVKAGVVLVTKGKLALGDTILIKGHTTDFKQKITSMQIDNAAIKEAKPKQEIGVLVKFRVRHGDVVYKL